MKQIDIGIARCGFLLSSPEKTNHENNDKLYKIENFINLLLPQDQNQQMHKNM